MEKKETNRQPRRRSEITWAHFLSGVEAALDIAQDIFTRPKTFASSINDHIRYLFVFIFLYGLISISIYLSIYVSDIIVNITLMHFT